MVTLQEDRRYELIIGDYQTGDGLKITDLQIKFDISKSADNKRTGNTAYVEVYNLSRSTLGKLETEYLTCSLALGYRDTGIQTVLSGNVVETSTSKSGPDQITKLSLGEGYSSLNHQRLNELVAPGKTLIDVIEAIRSAMPGVARGAYVGANLNNKVLYGYPLNGAPRELLTRFARENKLEWRIDNFALYVNEENGLVNTDTSEAPVVSIDTGLIDIPYYVSGDQSKLPTDQRRRTGVQFKALLNPNIIPGKLIRLESTVLPQLTGFYRVNDVKYSGDYRGNDWTMDCVCSQVFDVELVE
ncbi:hypothetical protein D3C85_584970 [compost metagenome]